MELQRCFPNLKFARYLSLSIQYMPPNLTFWRFILILSCNLCLGLVTLTWNISIMIHSLFFVAQQPILGPGHIIFEAYRSHKHTNTHRKDCSRRVTSPSHTSLPTQNSSSKRDENPCNERDSNQRYTKLSAFRFTPSTAGPVGPFILWDEFVTE